MNETFLAITSSTLKERLERFRILLNSPCPNQSLTVAIASASINMEELQARHRKEQRDLQSRITQKKKQASKKTRKGVNEECDRLEAELKLKQNEEINTFNGNGITEQDAEAPREALEDLTLEANGNDAVPVANGHTTVSNAVSAHEDNNGQSQPKKQNRAKARLARRAAEQEELVKQAQEEAKNMPDLKQQERERMLEYMKERGLQEKVIRADGHCLYSAVADQLEQLEIPLGSILSDTPSYKITRAAAADYVEQHQDDFAPFLEEPLPEYLHKVRDTGEWGGQIELMALAKSYGTDINVLQDFGRVEKIESGKDSADSKTMWLGYYKHGFGLGEHYNSLRKIP